MSTLGMPRLTADQLRVQRAERAAQIAREDSGEARGFRYAIECGCGWVGPWHLPGPRVHHDSCTHRDPVIYEGDRESAQARVQRHRERNRSGGAVHHTPMIVPESEIPRRIAAHRWG
jgi:hypothetical protein